MGYNTAAIILNDALDTIERDPDIGRHIGDSINSAWRTPQDITARKLTVNGGTQSHIGAIRVLPSRHADETQIVAVGGNTIQLLGYSFSDDPVRILKDLALQLGYNVSKKRVK